MIFEQVHIFLQQFAWLLFLARPSDSASTLARPQPSSVDFAFAFAVAAVVLHLLCKSSAAICMKPIYIQTKKLKRCFSHSVVHCEKIVGTKLNSSIGKGFTFDYFHLTIFNHLSSGA